MAERRKVDRIRDGVKYIWQESSEKRRVSFRG